MLLQNLRKIRCASIHLPIWAVVFVLSLLFSAATMADDSPAESGPEDVWRVSADRIDYDQIRDSYTAVGNVSITKEGRTLTADRAQLNQKSRQAFAQGNVRLVSGEDVLSGKRMLLDLDSETGTLTDGTLYISKNKLYLSGHKIRKTGPGTYSAENIRLTSCKGPDPAWKLTGKDLKVTVEGFGQAKHTTLWAGNVPVIYSPYLIFPVKTKRQSGLLMPEFGYSNRKGSEYLQPVYWAINDQSDATLYLHYMSQRGVRSGVEYRYVLDENSLGTILVEMLHDERIDDGQGDASERWGYDDDDQLRPNDDRYWVRMKHDQALAGGVKAKLDIDVVSDQDYLHEFKTGAFGFDNTLDYFEETFGRTIDDYNDPVRLNRLNLNRTWSRYSLNADLRWYDDVIARRTAESDDTLQELPAVELKGIKQPLGASPFLFDLTSSYSHFYRINGTRGHRTDLYPRIYYPTTLWGALSVEPSAGLRQTAWRIDDYETQPDHGRDTLYRVIYDLKLDVSTEFYRIFDWGLAGSDRIKHAITPEVIYEYTPEEDQSDFPNFDELDRIERKNLITYGFTNTFTSRTPRKTNDGPATYTYTPFMRFKVSQSYDINKDREGDPEPFSAITAELDLTPEKYVSLDTDVQWSPYDNQFESFNTTLRLWDLRGDNLSIDYRYTRETDLAAQDGIETISLDGELVLMREWLLRAGYEYNIFDDNLIEASVGVGYRTHCWGADFDYKVEDGNIGYTVVFHLMGLGSIGG